MSLRLRLALMAGVAAFAVTALFGAAVYLVTSQRLYASVDESLEQYAAQVTGRAERPAPFPISLPRTLGGHPDEFAIAYTADGTEVGRSPSATGLAISLPAEARRAALQGRSTSWTVWSGRQRYRLRVVPVQGGGAAARIRILATGSSLEGLDSLLANLRLILLAAAPAALALALLLSWVVAGRGLRPVRELTTAAGRLGTEDLSLRLPVGERRDELAGLTEAFNASLDRLEATYVALEEALARQRQFVADASHELRTRSPSSSTTPRPWSTTRRCRRRSAPSALRT
jgi:two-component system, OmpR family, sensor kinase